jgi:hypothetical protein
MRGVILLLVVLVGGCETLSESKRDAETPDGGQAPPPGCGDGEWGIFEMCDPKVPNSCKGGVCLDCRECLRALD